MLYVPRVNPLPPCEVAKAQPPDEEDANMAAGTEPGRTLRVHEGTLQNGCRMTHETWLAAHECT